MPTHTLGIIVNGATGRICSTQHLKNSLVAIRNEGGLAVGDKQVVPRPMLVGRDAARLAEVARTYGIADFTTDLDAALANTSFPVFFDAAATGGRLALLKQAVAAGKHIYSEKPVVPSVADGRALLAAVQARGLKHGAVEDKLYLPGFRKLAHVISEGTLGRIVGFKLDFGWWVFDGVEAPTQRPSWNYRRATGGGLVLDMFPHWRYVIEGLFGRIRRVTAATSTAVPERVDERGERYRVDVEDSASALVELESGAFGTILSSWATRVRRDDLLMLHVDGTDGSAIAGLHRCRVQTKAQTPRVANFRLDRDAEFDYRAGWSEVAALGPMINSYRAGWEKFLRHLVAGTPLDSDLSAGIRDVAFAEACYRSMAERRWVEVEAP
ncbi:MAG: Gfo/Idh/MocA family oxidoreductase [Bradyrhizobiaceae bacterium]|nr:Gfo/Idh/MocA family oxidoreductase [Hyphomicrobiales bacterium]MBV9427750.1 Gfo/Idh/MocA family oxidoreductase [Bradyrhizobiaceae bacterium]